jgi:hypothetical protein
MEISEDLALETGYSQGLIQEVRQPPSGIEDLEDLEEMSGDHILTRWANDQGTMELSFSDGLTKTPALVMQLGQHGEASKDLMLS